MGGGGAIAGDEGKMGFEMLIPPEVVRRSKGEVC